MCWRTVLHGILAAGAAAGTAACSGAQPGAELRRKSELELLELELAGARAGGGVLSLMHCDSQRREMD